MDNKTCCFIGHRNIEETTELKNALMKVIEDLILTENVDTFLFGSKGKFNDLCKKTLAELKNIYPHIRRIYVRAEFQYIDDNYRSYLLMECDDTYYPDVIAGTGRLSYIKRNYEMIDKSDYCVFYFNQGYAPLNAKNNNSRQPKSGTRISYEYAVRKGRKIINMHDEYV